MIFPNIRPEASNISKPHSVEKSETFSNQKKPSVPALHANKGLKENSFASYLEKENLEEKNESETKNNFSESDLFNILKPYINIHQNNQLDIEKKDDKNNVSFLKNKNNDEIPLLENLLNLNPQSPTEISEMEPKGSGLNSIVNPQAETNNISVLLSNSDPFQYKEIIQSQEPFTNNNGAKQNQFPQVMSPEVLSIESKESLLKSSLSPEDLLYKAKVDGDFITASKNNQMDIQSVVSKLNQQQKTKKEIILPQVITNLDNFHELNNNLLLNLENIQDKSSLEQNKFIQEFILSKMENKNNNINNLITSFSGIDEKLSLMQNPLSSVPLLGLKPESNDIYLNSIRNLSQDLHVPIEISSELDQLKNELSVKLGTENSLENLSHPKKIENNSLVNFLNENSSHMSKNIVYKLENMDNLKNSLPLSIYNDQENLSEFMGSNSDSDDKKGESHTEIFSLHGNNGELISHVDSSLSNLPPARTDINTTINKAIELSDQLKVTQGGVAKFQIQDSNLGLISLQVDMKKDGSVSISIQTESSIVKKEIEDQVDFLKQSLESQKITLTDLKVTTVEKSAPSQFNSSGQQGQDSQNPQNNSNSFQNSHNNFNQNRNNEGNNPVILDENISKIYSNKNYKNVQNNSSTNIQRTANGSIKVLA